MSGGLFYAYTIHNHTIRFTIFCAMSSSVKTYFLSPNFDFPPPPDGLITLGSILVDPKKPERSLNRNDQVAIPTGSIYNAHKDDWEVTRGQIREAEGGVWASFLSVILGLGGDLQINRSHNTNETYTCKRLETQYFQPDDVYIHQSLQNARVKSYFEQGWFRKPVYMITGLKVARGVTAKTSELEEYGFEGKLGVNGTSTGVPVAGGPKGRWTSKNDEGVSFSRSSDFVFAFQLIKIRSRKNDRLPTQEDFNKGALYDTDKSKEKVGSFEHLQDSWEISTLEDPTDEFPSVAVNSTVDEHGDVCRVISSGDT